MVTDNEDCIKFGLTGFSKQAETVQTLAIFVWEKLQ